MIHELYNGCDVPNEILLLLFIYIMLIIKIIIKLTPLKIFISYMRDKICIVFLTIKLQVSTKIVKVTKFI